MAKEYSSQIANTLISHMEEEEYKYEFDKENGLINMSFKIKSKLGRVKFVLNIFKDFYVSYAHIDLNADEDSRKEVAEYLTRANYGMSLGNFELDMSDGEIRYKVAIDCDHCQLSSQMIEDSLYNPILMFQRYGDEMIKVMMGTESAEEAIKIAEGQG